MRVKNQKMEQHCPSSVLLPCCHPQEPYRTIPLLLMSTQNIGGLQEEPPIKVPNPISQICRKDKHKRVSPFPAWKQSFTNPQFCPYSPAHGTFAQSNLNVSPLIQQPEYCWFSAYPAPQQDLPPVLSHSHWEKQIPHPCTATSNLSNQTPTPKQLSDCLLRGVSYWHHLGHRF